MSMLLLDFVIPCVMLFASWFVKKQPRAYPGPAPHMKKWKIDLNGYDTPRARKSQRHWDYAQQIAPKWLAYYGKLGLVVSAIWAGFGLFSPDNLDASVTGCVICGVGYLICAFRAVEKRLKIGRASCRERM